MGKKKKYTKYTDAFRASVVLMLEAAGYPDKKGALVQVSKHVGISHSTIRRWFKAEHNPPPANITQEKRVDFVDLIAKEMAAILGEMGSARMDASYRDLSVAFGILAEKKELLSGNATERTENRTLQVNVNYADD